MRRLRWSREARIQYRSWLAYLAGIDPALATRGGRFVDSRTIALASRPTDGRPSRWPGLRELGLTDWHKLVVYREDEAEVVVIAFYDMRQDLSVVSPAPEQR